MADFSTGSPELEVCDCYQSTAIHNKKLTRSMLWSSPACKWGTSLDSHSLHDPVKVLFWVNTHGVNIVVCLYVSYMNSIINTS